MNLPDSHIKAGTPAYMLRDYEMIKHIFAESALVPVSNFESANRKEVMGRKQLNKHDHKHGRNKNISGVLEDFLLISERRSRPV